MTHAVQDAAEPMECVHAPRFPKIEVHYPTPAARASAQRRNEDVWHLSFAFRVACELAPADRPTNRRCISLAWVIAGCPAFSARIDVLGHIAAPAIKLRVEWSPPTNAPFSIDDAVAGLNADLERVFAVATGQVTA